MRVRVRPEPAARVAGPIAAGNLRFAPDCAKGAPFQRISSGNLREALREKAVRTAELETE
jgi:hypothetical protein